MAGEGVGMTPRQSAMQLRRLVDALEAKNARLVSLGPSELTGWWRLVIEWPGVEGRLTIEANDVGAWLANLEPPVSPLRSLG